MAIEDDDPFASLNNDSEDSNDNSGTEHNEEDKDPTSDPFANLDTPESNPSDDPFANPDTPESNPSDDPFANLDTPESNPSDAFFAGTNVGGDLPEDLGAIKNDDTHLGGTEADHEHDEEEDPFAHIADEHEHPYPDVEPEGLGGVEQEQTEEDHNDPLNLLEDAPPTSLAMSIGSSDFSLDEPDPHADQAGRNEYYPTENEPRVDPFDSLMESLKKGQEFVSEFQNRHNAILNMQTSTSTEATPSTAPAASGHAPKLQSYITILGKKLFAPAKERVKVSDEEREEVQRKLAYLEKRIEETKIAYRNHEKKSGSWAFTFQILSASLAAIVTVLLGINVTDLMRSYSVDWFINTIALIISAFISVIGVIQGFYKPKGMFIKYSDTGNKLEQLQALLEYLKLGGDYVSLADINLVKLEFDRIIESTHNYEMQIKADDDEVSSRIIRQGNEDEVK